MSTMEAAGQARQALDYTRFSRVGGALAIGLMAGPALLALGGWAFPALLGLAGLAAVSYRRYWGAARRSVYVWLAAAWIVWTSLSALWSPGWTPGLVGVLALTAFALGAFVSGSDLSRGADRAVARRAALAGLVGAVLAVCLDAAFGWPAARAAIGFEETPERMHHLSEATRAAAGGLGLMAFGACALLLRQGMRGIAIAAAVLIGVAWVAWRAEHFMALAALGAATLAACFAWFQPRGAVESVAQVGALSLAGAPWLLPPAAEAFAAVTRGMVGPDLAFALSARAHSWAFVTDRVREKALFGWGVGASSGFQETYSSAGWTLPFVPVHPHSAGMQVWLETGVIGAVVAAGALAAMGRRAGAALAQDNIGAMAGAGVIAGALTLAVLDAGLWNGWFWAALALSAGMIRLSREA